jgi:Methyltransferase FkbM domain
MKLFLKKLLFGNKPSFRKIKFGVASGIIMKIDPINKTQRLIGLYEFEILSYFRRFSTRYDNFLDIGSAEGFYGLIFRKYNPNGKVFSCDAVSEFYDDQIQNFKENNFGTAEDFTFISLSIGNIDSDNSITIDTIASKNSVKSALLKIDIEGAELMALKGAESLLRNQSSALIIETHSLELEKQCIQFLTDLNYSCKVIKNSAVRHIFPETRNLEHNRWLVSEPAL